MRNAGVRGPMLVAALMVLAVFVAACGGGSGEAQTGTVATTVAPPVTTTLPPTTTTVPLPAVDRRTGVGVRTETYVDPSRPTSSNGSFPGASTRTFPVTIWYPASGDPDTAVPDAPPDRTGGPLPLIVFAHGYAVTPTSYEELLRRWASAGYVVAAPTYPILSGIPGGPGHADYELSFADTSFIITELLRTFGGAPNSNPLVGLVDPQRIGVAGHSDGEVISYGMGFLVCCRDPRVKAVVAMAGDLSNIANPVQRDNGVPVLHILGTNDEFDPYDHAIDWDRDNLTAPKWSVTLVNGSHAPPYRSPSSPYFDGIVTMTTDFFDGTLKNRPDRLTRIDAYVAANSSLFRLDR